MDTSRPLLEPPDLAGTEPMDGSRGATVELGHATPTVRTERVALRPFTPDDAPLVLAAADDPYICQVTTVTAGGDLDDALSYVDRQNARPRRGLGHSFAVTDTATGQAVGQIGVWTTEIASGRITLGYWIAPAHRRQGYARAALAAATGWAWTLPGVHRIQLYVEPWNVGSWRAAQACGYEREGLLRSWQEIAGERRDLYVYSLIR